MGPIQVLVAQDGGLFANNQGGHRNEGYKLWSCRPGLNLSPPTLQQAASPLYPYSLICKVGCAQEPAPRRTWELTSLGRQPSTQGRVHTRASGMSPCCGFAWPHLTQPQRQTGCHQSVAGNVPSPCKALCSDARLGLPTWVRKESSRDRTAPGGPLGWGVSEQGPFMGRNMVMRGERQGPGSRLGVAGGLAVCRPCTQPLLLLIPPRSEGLGLPLLTSTLMMDTPTCQTGRPRPSVGSSLTWWGSHHCG